MNPDRANARRGDSARILQARPLGIVSSTGFKLRLELPYFRNSGNVETSGCERMILAPYG